jgi:hypothetical protein
VVQPGTAVVNSPMAVGHAQPVRANHPVAGRQAVSPEGRIPAAVLPVSPQPGSPQAPVSAVAAQGIRQAPNSPNSPNAANGANGANANSDGGRMLGRARVPQAPARSLDDDDCEPAPVDDPRPWPPPARADIATLKRGGRLTCLGGSVALVCWGIWTISGGRGFGTSVIPILVVFAVAAGIFALVRLIGRLVLEQRLGRVRHSARVAHALTGLFLACAGIAYLQQTEWVIDVETWVTDHLL